MKRLQDYAEFEQRTPRYKPITSLETGSSLTATKYVKLEDFLAMQQTLQDKINEQTSLLEHILKALKLLVIVKAEVDPDEEDVD